MLLHFFFYVALKLVARHQFGFRAELSDNLRDYESFGGRIKLEPILILLQVCFIAPVVQATLVATHRCADLPINCKLICLDR